MTDKNQMTFLTGVGYLTQSAEPMIVFPTDDTAKLKTIWYCHSKGLCGKFHLVCTGPTDSQVREKAKKFGIKKFLYRKVRVS
jgi:hypothetical protein